MNESIPYAKALLQAVRGMKFNTERFTRAAKDFATTEKSGTLLMASLRIKRMLEPSIAMFDGLESSLEKWLENAENTENNDNN